MPSAAVTLVLAPWNDQDDQETSMEHREEFKLETKAMIVFINYCDKVMHRRIIAISVKRACGLRIA